MNPESMDAVFQALAHASRRQMLDIVKNNPGCHINAVSSNFEMSRIAVMKHLRILEDAGLIVSEKDGRARKLYFNSVPIQLIYDRWTTEYSAFWATQLTDLKFALENKPKPKSASLSQVSGDSDGGSDRKSRRQKRSSKRR